MPVIPPFRRQRQVCPKIETRQEYIIGRERGHLILDQAERM